MNYKMLRLNIIAPVLALLVAIGFTGTTQALTPQDVFGGAKTSEPAITASSSKKSQPVQILPPDDTPVTGSEPMVEQQPVKGTQATSSRAATSSVSVADVPPTNLPAGSVSSDGGFSSDAPLPEMSESAPTPPLNMLAQIVSVLAVTGFAGGVLMTLRKPPVPRI